MDSKTQLYEHSAAKVRLLKEYMSAYLGILANSEWIKEIYLYDLFCGPGIYENKGKGSPIVFLEEIIRANTKVATPRNKPTTFKCLFNDLDKSKVEALQNNIAHMELDISKIGSINFSTKDYRNVLVDVKNQITPFKNERGFIFIDPYGYSDISLNDIKQLTYNGKCEVLLFMPTHFMYRFTKAGTPECLINFLDDLNITGSLSNLTGLEFIEAVKDGFQMTLSGSVYVDSFIIQRDVNQFFCLFFFTSNKLGFLKMLEAKWKIDKEEGRGWQPDTGFNLFSDQVSPNTTKLRQLIIDYLKTGSKSNGDLFEYTIKNRFLPKHTTEVLKQLQSENKIEVVGQDKHKVKKGAFYVSWESCKKSPQLISIILKQA